MKGFKTAQGSTYVLLADGRTVRTKKSSGKGQGQTCIPHACLYVPAAALTHLVGMGAAGMGFWIGFQKPDGTFKSFGAGAPVVPAGCKPWVVVYDKHDRKVVTHGPAMTAPAIGLHPVEKTYTDDGFSHSHVGNAIVEIYE